MSRIPMAVASTLVVLAALGVAHLVVFRSSSASVEAAPPDVAPAVVNGGHSYVVPAGGVVEGPTSRQATFAIRALYTKARAQIQSQTREAASVRAGCSEAAEGCAKVVDSCSGCVCESCDKGCSQDCPAICAGWQICGGNGPISLKVFRGLFVEEECCCDDLEECKNCPSKVAGVANGAKRSEVAQKIDDFAAADEFPLGRIVAGVGTWFHLRTPQTCPLCPPGQACNACKEACGCLAAVARPPCAAVAEGKGFGQGVTGNVTSKCTNSKPDHVDNCPGAELEGNTVPRTLKEESRDRALAEQISQIEDIRRERAHHLLEGTLLEGSDENEAHDFGEALRLVAGYIEGESVPPPPSAVPGSEVPGYALPEEVPGVPGVADPLLVDVLRHAGRLLDLRSHDLEDIGHYHEADHLRSLAQAIRFEARKAAPTGSEGGCGLFCPSAAAKAMCAPSIERTAKRRPEVIEEGPVKK